MINSILRDLYREFREIYYLFSGKPRGIGYIMMMHHVLPKNDLHMPEDISQNITPESLDIFVGEAQKYFEFIPLGDLPERVAHPHKKKFIVLTFDDGFESVYKYASPILEKYGVPFSVFVSTGFIGKPCTTYKTKGLYENGMSVESLRKLMSTSRATIGGHTVTHQRLAHIPVEQMEQEVSTNILHLKELLGINVTTFAYPYGDYNDDVLKCMSSSDNNINLCVLATGNAICLHNTDFFLLPRVNLDETITAKGLLHWRNRYMGL